MKKLSLKHHKTILPIVLLIVLIIAIFFGATLASFDNNTPIIMIIMFALLFLVFVMSTLNFSILVRLRDEHHSMHEENKQNVRVLHEKLKKVHDHIMKKK